MAQVKAIFSLVTGHLIPVINGTHTNCGYRFKDMSTNLDIRSMHLIPEPKGTHVPVLCAKNYAPLTSEQRVDLTPVAGFDPLRRAAKEALSATTLAKPNRQTIYGALLLDLQTFSYKVTPFPPFDHTYPTFPSIPAPRPKRPPVPPGREPPDHQLQHPVSHPPRLHSRHPRQHGTQPLLH